MNGNKGKKQTEEHIRKRVLSRGIFKNSEETKKKISETCKRKGIKPPISKGDKFTEEHKKHLSEARMGRFGGKNCPAWKGGISFEPYTLDWTKSLRISIRERDHYTCKICGEKQGDRAFSVHHIDYNKLNCNSDNLLTLCLSCHMKTNYNRKHWINYFKGL